MSTAIGLSPGAQAGSASARRQADLKACSQDGGKDDCFDLRLVVPEDPTGLKTDEHAQAPADAIPILAAYNTAQPELAATLTVSALEATDHTDRGYSKRVLGMSAHVPVVGEPCANWRSRGELDSVVSKRPEVSVLCAETHFEPQVRPVVDQVFEHLHRQLDGEPTTSPGIAHGRPWAVPGAQPVRVLRIELRPADLGVVHVSMRLVAGRLEVALEASRAETARWLGGQREVLSELLRGVGFDAAEVEIRASVPAESPRSASRSGRISEERQWVRRTQQDGAAEGMADPDRGGVYL